jgi:hypothetical protein
MDIRMEGEQWPVVGGLVVAAHYVVSMLQRKRSHSRGSTGAAKTMQNRAVDGRSTWSEMRRTGTSRASAPTVAPAAVRSSDKTMTVDDVLNAQSADLGTREHAISLLDGIAQTVAETAVALYISGDESGSMNMEFLMASCMDTLDLFLGLEDVA